MNPDDPKPVPPGSQRLRSPHGPQKRISGRLMLSLFLAIAIPMLFSRDLSMLFLLPLFPVIGGILGWSGWKAAKRDPNLTGPRLGIFCIGISVVSAIFYGYLVYRMMPLLSAGQAIEAKRKAFAGAIERRNYESLFETMSKSYRESHDVGDIRAEVEGAFPGEDSISLSTSPDSPRPRVDAISFGTVDGSIVVGSSTLTSPASVWEIEGASHTAGFGRSTRPLACVDLSQNGGRFLGVGLDNDATVWSVTQGVKVGMFHWDSEQITAAGLSSSGDRGAAGNQAGGLVVWKVGSGEVEHLLEGHESPVLDVEFSPDGKRLLSAARDRTCILWDLEAGTERSRFTGGGPVGFSTDGSQIFVGEGARLKLLDAGNGEALRTLAGSTIEVISAAFSSDDRSIAVGLSNGTIRLFDVATGEKRTELEFGEDPVLCVTFSQGDVSLAAGTSDGKLKLWRLSGDGGDTEINIGEEDAKREIELQRTIVDGDAERMTFLWRSEVEYQEEDAELYLTIDLLRSGRTDYEAEITGFQARSLAHLTPPEKTPEEGPAEDADEGEGTPK